MVASLAVPFGLLGREAPTADGTPIPDPRDPTADASASASAAARQQPSTPRGTSSAGSGQPSPSAAPSGPSPNAIPPGATKVSTVSAVTSQGSAAFTVPFNAPPPLPAGDPGIIVRLADGSFVAYDAVCTHEGCTVEWDKPSGVIVCPCHGAAFDAADNAAVLQGPARQPLVSLPIVVDAASGTIYLKA